MKKTIAIIGGGPAAIMLAAHLNENLFDVTIYEKNTALGRKFLVAGKGGFNLTHSESVEDFIKKYIPNSFLQNSITNFSNTDLRKWLSLIGIETYVGTSKRVFPVKGIKPIEVLNAILNQLKAKKVNVCISHNWQGFAGDGNLIFDAPNGIKNAKADITVFALGGNSWKVTGSDGTWVQHFTNKGIDCVPFQASNCSFGVNWPKPFIDKAAGQILKNCNFICGNKTHKGEAVVTQFGIEGSGVYPLSNELRKQLNTQNKAVIYIDLKPQITAEEIVERLKNRKKINLSKVLESNLKISDVKLSLLKTCLSKDEFIEPLTLTSKIKNFPLHVIALAPIDDAISTIGGIALTEVDENFQIKKLSSNYAIGEMLDWDAPTGGYLLQACFSMGYGLAAHLNTKHT